MYYIEDQTMDMHAVSSKNSLNRCVKKHFSQNSKSLSKEEDLIVSIDAAM
jgi:hypothetical protein